MGSDKTLKVFAMKCGPVEDYSHRSRLIAKLTALSGGPPSTHMLRTSCVLVPQRRHKIFLRRQVPQIRQAP